MSDETNLWGQAQEYMKQNPRPSAEELEEVQEPEAAPEQENFQFEKQAEEAEQAQPEPEPEPEQPFYRHFRTQEELDRYVAQLEQERERLRQIEEQRYREAYEQQQQEQTSQAEESLERRAVELGRAYGVPEEAMPEALPKLKALLKTAKEAASEDLKPIQEQFQQMQAQQQAYATADKVYNFLQQDARASHLRDFAEDIAQSIAQGANPYAVVGHYDAIVKKMRGKGVGSAPNSGNAPANRQRVEKPGGSGGMPPAPADNEDFTPMWERRLGLVK